MAGGSTGSGWRACHGRRSVDRLGRPTVAPRRSTRAVRSSPTDVHGRQRGRPHTPARVRHFLGHAPSVATGARRPPRIRPCHLPHPIYSTPQAAWPSQELIRTAQRCMAERPESH